MNKTATAFSGALFLATSFLIIACRKEASPASGSTASSSDSTKQTPQKVAESTDPSPDTLIGACPTRTNVKPPDPDKMDLLFKSNKRFRLVIGVGTFKGLQDKKEERDYVEPTAKLVDARLSQLKYDPLPNLKVPYLTGARANLASIRAALDTMRAVVGPNDIGVIYYVGHGVITDSHDDLSLAVYDRPVATGEGIRVSDILGILQDKTYHKDIPQIPRFLIVLDTCYSGTAANAQNVAIDSSSGLQTIVFSNHRAVVPQIAVLTATSPGGDKEAYGLKDTKLSAFGYFFARALDEDWECADVDSPDGILTLSELKFYLKSKLEKAKRLNAINAAMVPTLLSGVEKSFIAYDPRHYSVPGARSEILNVEVNVPKDVLTTVLLPSGTQIECASGQKCSFILSKTELGDLAVVSQPKLDLGQVFGSLTGEVMARPNSADIGILGDKARHAHADKTTVDSKFPGMKSESIDVQSLINRKEASLAGVSLKVKDGGVS